MKKRSKLKNKSMKYNEDKQLYDLKRVVMKKLCKFKAYINSKAKRRNTDIIKSHIEDLKNLHNIETLNINIKNSIFETMKELNSILEKVNKKNYCSEELIEKSKNKETTNFITDIKNVSNNKPNLCTNQLSIESNRIDSAFIQGKVETNNEIKRKDQSKELKLQNIKKIFQSSEEILSQIEANEKLEDAVLNNSIQLSHKTELNTIDNKNKTLFFECIRDGISDLKEFVIKEMNEFKQNQNLIQQGSDLSQHEKCNNKNFHYNIEMRNLHNDHKGSEHFSIDEINVNIEKFDSICPSTNIEIQQYNKENIQNILNQNILKENFFETKENDLNLINIYINRQKVEEIKKKCSSWLDNIPSDKQLDSNLSEKDFIVKNTSFSNAKNSKSSILSVSSDSDDLLIDITETEGNTFDKTEIDIAKNSEVEKVKTLSTTLSLSTNNNILLHQIHEAIQNYEEHSNYDLYNNSNIGSEIPASQSPCKHKKKCCFAKIEN